MKRSTVVLSLILAACSAASAPIATHAIAQHVARATQDYGVIEWQSNGDPAVIFGTFTSESTAASYALTLHDRGYLASVETFTSPPGSLCCGTTNAGAVVVYNGSGPWQSGIMEVVAPFLTYNDAIGWCYDYRSNYCNAWEIQPYEGSARIRRHLDTPGGPIAK